MKCRIVSWNIWEGIGAQIKDGVPSINKTRLQNIQETLKELNPDIVVLNEALWCEPHNGLFIDYKKLLGYKYSCAALYDNHWGNIILSNTPLDKKSVFRIYNRGGLSVQWCGLTVATYHPHPHRYPAHKAQDFKRLLQHLVGPIVVCGDFNAISPDDKIDEVALTAAFSSFSPTPAVSLARFTEGGRVIFKTLNEMGFQDAVKEKNRHPTIPTKLLNEDDASSVRIDHSWVKNVNSCCAKVVANERTHFASDHLPLVTNIEFSSLEYSHTKKT